MIEDFYTESFTVTGKTTAASVSAIGSFNPTFGSVGSFMGFMDYLSGQERPVAAQYIDKATHIIGCSSTCSWIKPAYKISDSNSKVYRVLHIDNPIMRDHHLEILLEYNESDNLSS